MSEPVARSSVEMWRFCQVCSPAGRVGERDHAEGQSWKMIKTCSGGDMQRGWQE